jgi:G:T-mismatch repair DNA endonuclease (very short patch repair protein)
MKFCLCGCGQEVYSKDNYYFPVYVKGHNTKGKTTSAKGKKRGPRDRGVVNKIALSNTGKKRSKEQKLKISNSMKGKPGRVKSVEELEKLREATKLRWQNGDFKGKFLPSSKMERKLAPILEKIDYSNTIKNNYIIKSGSKTRIPDFYNEKEKKIIEVFGNYWHKNRLLPEGRRHETDIEVILWYHNLGWNCVIIWEDEFDEYYKKLVEKVVLKV